MFETNDAVILPQQGEIPKRYEIPILIPLLSVAKCPTQKNPLARERKVVQGRCNLESSWYKFVCFFSLTGKQKTSFGNNIVFQYVHNF